MKDAKPLTHVACIMDGNRRWAQSKGLTPHQGHEAGIRSLEQVCKHALQRGIKILTCYTLSTENIKERSTEEIGHLWRLISMLIIDHAKKLEKSGIRIACIGDMSGIPVYVQDAIHQAESIVPAEQKLLCNLAINYGGRREICSALRTCITKGIDLKTIDESTIGAHLYTAGLPDPELLIRTGGGHRTSNFLIWQTIYSELYFTDLMWPDFDTNAFDDAINWYYAQTRNFGK